MTKTYSGLVAINGNLMAAVDVETTGTRAAYHEIIQIAVVPLNSDLRPLPNVRPFYTTMKPLFPERRQLSANFVHKLDINELVLHAPEPGRVQDLLVEWFQKLELPVGKCLVPLAHNWAFEAKFLQAWLGVDLCQELFHSHARDGMLLAISMNDRAAFAGEELPFSRVGLGSLCRKFGVTNASAHDALCDCLAEAEVYRALLHMNLF